jgi:hypothetical protein
MVKEGRMVKEVWRRKKGEGRKGDDGDGGDDDGGSVLMVVVAMGVWLW